MPTTFTACDKQLKEAAGITVIELHGCNNPKCNKHVYGPEDKSTHCPCCGESRFDETGTPKEVCAVL